MILVLEDNIEQKQVEQLLRKLAMMRLRAVQHRSENHHTLAIVDGMDGSIKRELFVDLPFVKDVLVNQEKNKLVGKAFKPDRTVIDIQGRKIGDGSCMIMAGPCSIESEEQIFATARLVKAAGATVLRGGAFKPRTSPYDFQGLGEAGLQLLHDAARQYDLLTISEVMDVDAVELMGKYVDILQIGTRNMQNFSLLKAVGKAGKPALLKRGFSATYRDLLAAAEYIMSEGNPNVILCERGIRTFETYSRNTLDIAAVPMLRELTHLPIVVDPSHGTGIRSMVAPMAQAALAVKADGIIVEVHPEPDKSVSDAQQTISPDMFANMMQVLRRIGEAVEVVV